MGDGRWEIGPHIPNPQLPTPNSHWSTRPRRSASCSSHRARRAKRSRRPSGGCSKPLPCKPASRRMLRDLHDGLGPQLASLTLTLAAARELLRHDVDAADRLLQELAGHTQAAIADIRRVVYDLRPPALDDLGLVLALREQAAHYRQAGLQIMIDAPDHLPALPAAVEVAAYRIVQEALTNVVHHAQARACTVCLTLGDALIVTIRDDGVGLPPGGRAGVGLTSMRERTAELGGTCQIESVPGQGARIHARLPLHQEGV